MSKINDEFENPIDLLCYRFVQKHLSFYYDLGLTPNHITTFSLLSGLLSAKFIYTDNKFLAISFLLLSYYFDNADGALARKYKLYSKFGDYYDHISV